MMHLVGNLNLTHNAQLLHNIAFIIHLPAFIYSLATPPPRPCCCHADLLIVYLSSCAHSLMQIYALSPSRFINIYSLSLAFSLFSLSQAPLIDSISRADKPQSESFPQICFLNAFYFNCTLQSAVQSFIYSHMCRAHTHIFEGFSRPQTSTATNL